MNRLVFSLCVCQILTGCVTLGPDPVPAVSENPVTGSPGQDVAPGAKDEGLDSVERHYRDLALTRPRDPQPWFELGNYYAANGRLAGAEFAYREALKRENDPKVLHNLGLVQVRLGVNALSEAHRDLPPDDPAREQTRQFLRVLLEQGL